MNAWSTVATSALAIAALLPTHTEIDVHPGARSPNVLLEAERATNRHTPRSTRAPAQAAAPAPAPASRQQHVDPAALQRARIEETFRAVCPVRTAIIGMPCMFAPEQPASPVAAPVAPAAPSEGDIVRAVRELGLPALRVRIEPATTTLVNVPTNLYAEPELFERSLELLGTPVQIRATPSSFTWHHGDGTTQRTASAGRPYPHLDVTHRYTAPAESVEVRVDVTYAVEYAIADEPWQQLDAAITATGPASALTVREAAPVLVHP